MIVSLVQPDCVTLIVELVAERLLAVVDDVVFVGDGLGDQLNVAAPADVTFRVILPLLFPQVG